MSRLASPSDTRALLAAASLALAAAIGLAGPASAHALLASSDPAVGANLDSAPTVVTLTFTESPDPRLSSIKVLDAAGASVTAGTATAIPGKPNELRVALKPLPKGIYTVSWRTVSSVDGHTATGSFAFGVGAAPPTTSTASSSSGEAPLRPVAVVGRWLLYAGLIVLLGAAFAGTLIFAAPPPTSLLLAAVGWLFALVGTGVVLGDQLVGAGLGLGDLVGTSLGTSLLLRGAPLLVGGAVLAVLLRRGVPTRLGLVTVGVVAGAAMLADTLESHAAASGAVAFNIAVQWVHVVASGIWLGGLLALLVGLRGQPGPLSAATVRRFATSATFGIALVAATGVIRGLSEIGAWGNLVSTAFGWLLLGKSGLLGVIAVLGAVNHFRNVPAAGRTLRPLRRFGSSELVLASAILVLTASLVNLAPPGQVAAATTLPPSISASGADFGTALRIRLTASPGAAGFNTFRATLTDYDTGASLDGRTVTLGFSLPARPDVGASQLTLKAAGDGVYQATGGNLSIDGTWRVTVQVSGGGTSTEVTLQLTTRRVPPKIDVNAQPGLPTIYTVHLSGGDTVQVYADPGKAGANELHMTFFDPTGTELPVRTASVSIGLKDAPPIQAKLRLLEPGHFVADTTLKAGTYTVSISGTPPIGAPLTTQLEVPIS